MSNELLFRLFLGIILITLTGLEVYYLVRMRPATAANRDVERENKLTAVLPATLIDLGLLTTALYIIRPEWITWSGFALPWWLRWAGVGLALGGLLLRVWAHLALGRNYAWYMLIQGSQQLVTHGPYSRVRHPMYAAALLLTFGISLAVASWLTSALLIVPAFMTLAWRLDREEAMLVKQFGEEYREYQRRTGRLLPHW